MSTKYPYLTDSSFLLKVDKMPIKESYVKVILLNYEEKPLRAIEGTIISGTLNLSGDSSVRRTGNIQMLADKYKNDLTNLDNLISINKKIKLELGYVNMTDSYKEYDIIWFPLGIYVISAPSLSFSSQGVTITLQLKDKMALLNGECGGTLPAAVTFSEYDTVDENGAIVTIYPTMYQIIQEAVNHFGEEQLSKIIISDVPLRAKQVMKWLGSTPLYMTTETVIDSDGNEMIGHNVYTNEETAYEHDPSPAVYEYGDDIGYIYTDFTYPGNDLVGEAGQTVCDVLDKIKNALGNYEYFYDVDGNFIFQEIKNYLNTSQSTIELDKMQNEDYLVDMSKGKAVYVFDDSQLITSYTNSPQYTNIKNDFIVWGAKENANGNDVAVRYHLAIDAKPQLSDSYEVFFYDDPNDGLRKAKCPIKYDDVGTDQFPVPGAEEVFYMDSIGTIYKWNPNKYEYEEVDVKMQSITPTDWRTELYLQGAAAEPFGKDSNYYYTELANEWPKLYDVEEGEFYAEVLKYPCDIDFFLDFIDTGAAISEISVGNIGRRTKVVVDDDVNCVFEPEIPDIIMLSAGSETLDDDRKECEQAGQEYIQVDKNIYSMLAGGGTHNSAYEYVRELLYQYTSYNESITLAAIPIYYLEPNTRITVRNTQAGIYGDYLISTISLPLDVSGSMNISATRALERI